MSAGPLSRSMPDQNPPAIRCVSFIKTTMMQTKKMLRKYTMAIRTGCFNDEIFSLRGTDGGKCQRQDREVDPVQIFQRDGFKYIQIFFYKCMKQGFMRW